MERSRDTEKTETEIGLQPPGKSNNSFATWTEAENSRLARDFILA